MILTIKFTINYIKLCFDSLYGNVTIFKIKKDNFYKKYGEYTFKNLENYIYSQQFKSKQFNRLSDFLSSVYVTKIINSGGN